MRAGLKESELLNGSIMSRIDKLERENQILKSYLAKLCESIASFLSCNRIDHAERRADLTDISETIHKAIGSLQ